MNIFALNEDPIISAKQHFDKHVVKMPTELAQMLCTGHRVLDGKKELSNHLARKPFMFIQL
jgi:hypothetical protein